jgi:hypothetical protein
MRFTQEFEDHKRGFRWWGNRRKTYIKEGSKAPVGMGSNNCSSTDPIAKALPAR